MAEGDFAAPLREVEESAPGLSIGSYPATKRVADRAYNAKITVEGRSEAAVAEATARILGVVQGTLQPRAVPGSEVLP